MTQEQIQKLDEHNNSMEVDVSVSHDGEMSSPLSDARSDVEVIVNAEPPATEVSATPNIIHAPDGTIIVETLDTPALRRQKTLRRKAEKLRLAAEAEAASFLLAGPSQLPASAMRSESSSLTDLDGNEEGREIGLRSESKPHTSILPKDPAAVILSAWKVKCLREVHLVSHTFNQLSNLMLNNSLHFFISMGQSSCVRSHFYPTPSYGLFLESYPWWPAVVFEPDDPGVPSNILRGKDQVRRTGDGLLHLVRFFDKFNSW